MSKIIKTPEAWRAVLNKKQFEVLRNSATEAPFTGEYDKEFGSGAYDCAGCGNPLYKSTAKFNSGCGWPAFFEAIPGAITLRKDSSLGRERTEMICAKCDGHLGHVFYNEGFDNPTNERHCVNSVSLTFKPEIK